ncbi:protein-glutamine gamma-glutamyltransferase [Pseudalkalibacillus hwajinpoensis]|uniref:Protein-glutamine gamma-glutamyltransferase n=1 Tax=Guptibacillus hwajinpoensis TaxID=208199 RepID=A0A4U1MDG3_9BACL|nr:protein-glutamine gamma-glutamyltransferase [Pseudalkalibacillus hwajinpoensis]TKD68783.1 protein-glutamine gamma-glutamyltransferase [Pseudalkalibacillus hwajinpoensis]
MIIIGGSGKQKEEIMNAGLQSPLEQTILNVMYNSNFNYSFRTLEALFFEVRFRVAITESSRELYYSGVQFADFYRSHCNPMFWQLLPDGAFQLKMGVPASEAVLDIYRNGRLYAFECATAMIIILYRAAIKMIPPQQFNRLFANIRLWGWKFDQDLQIVHNIPPDYLPGDIRYVKNPDVNPLTPEWQGENVVDLGDGTFFGHGLGFRPLQGMIEALALRRRPGATRMPYLMLPATRPGFSYLYQFTYNRTEDSRKIILFDKSLKRSTLSIEDYENNQDEFIKNFITVRFPKP